MNRSIKALALAAFALAAALGATSAQASAANSSVNFRMKNGNPVSTVNMTRTSSLPTTITGLIDPPASIADLAFDPGSGTALYSELLPGLGSSTQASVTYADASDNSSPCTFTISVHRDNNALQPYYVHFSSSAARCVVPGDARSSNGVFSGTFTLSWSK